MALTDLAIKRALSGTKSSSFQTVAGSNCGSRRMAQNVGASLIVFVGSKKLWLLESIQWSA